MIPRIGNRTDFEEKEKNQIIKFGNCIPVLLDESCTIMASFGQEKAVFGDKKKHWVRAWCLAPILDVRVSM
jgi:hypothetical protein